MKSIRISIIAPVVSVLAISCGNTNKTQLIPPPMLDLVSISAEELKPNYAPVTAAVAGDFSFNIFKALSEEESICISPYSAAAVLSMAAEGANGRTGEQMLEVLGRLRSERPSSPSVKVANSIWVNKKIDVKPEFDGLMKEKYLSSVYDRDFSLSSTLQEINRWCNDNTNGKIPSILGRIDDGMLMVLLNAIYFRDKWKEPFNRIDKVGFNCLDGSIKNVDMMHRTARTSYFRNDIFQMVELPYENEDINMVVLLPLPNISFQNAVSTLNTKDWNRWMDEMEPERVRISLPEFKLECEFDLTKTLQAMGMNLAFTRQADFSGMTDSPVAIDCVIQKTYIDVNEEGTEAAAVTGLVTRATSVAPELTIDFTADRPFIYVIHSRSTDEILFIGQVVTF